MKLDERSEIVSGNALIDGDIWRSVEQKDFQLTLAAVKMLRCHQSGKRHPTGRLFFSAKKRALGEHSIPHFCLLTQLIKTRFSHFYDHKVISAMLPRVASSENSPPQVEGEATSNAATGGGRATSGEKNLMNFSTLPKDSMLNGIKSSVYAMTRV